MNSDQVVGYLKQNSIRSAVVADMDQVNQFLKTSKHKGWVYLIRFNGAQDRFAWGTTSKAGKRIRNSCIFDSKLTGKYDRRVDYLMLKQIHGLKSVHLFECRGNEVEVEEGLRQVLQPGTSRGPCMSGFVAKDRDGIAREILGEFKKISGYARMSAQEQALFLEFCESFWLGKLKHPTKPKRTFYYGDCLEPNFIGRTLSRADLEPVIERALQVRF
jgi:hypothetical protein